MRQFIIDRTLRESITYRESSFPVELCLDDYETLPEHTLNCHWHHELEFGILLSGELDYTLSGIPVRLKEGDCIFVNANTMHMAKQADACGNARMFVASFSTSLLTRDMGSLLYQKYFQPVLGKGFPGFVIHGDGAEKKREPGIYHWMSKLYQLFLQDDQAEGFELQCLGLLTQIWLQAFLYITKHHPAIAGQPSNLRDEERAKQIMHYIREHYADKIVIEDILNALHISQSECFRCFKLYTHKTPVEYITEYRLACAAKMLMETRRPVTEIGYACGFSNTSYFCKQFKEHYEMTPAKYRRSFG